MLNFKDTQKINGLGLSSEAEKYLNTFSSLNQAWKKSNISEWMLLYCIYKEPQLIKLKQWVTLGLLFIEKIFPVYEEKYPDKSETLKEIMNDIKNWLKLPSKQNTDICDQDFFKVYNNRTYIGKAIFNVINIIKYNANADDYCYKVSILTSRSALESEVQADIIRQNIPNPFMPEHERLGLDKDTADPWKDILEDI